MSRVYDEIARNLLAMTDSAGRWRPCWHGSTAIRPPVNAVSGHKYAGVNILSLWVAAQCCGFGSHKWATYQQWQGVGAQVRKGEKSTPAVVFKSYNRENEEGGEDRILFARGFRLFNAAQVDGFICPDSYGDAPRNPDQEAEDARAFVANTGAMVRHIEGTTPCFIPSIDEIRMPPFERFHSAVGYYGTLLHELTHWTGAKARLGRDFSGKFGDESYALEELVAELGAAFLCADLGIEAEPREDHAQYLAHWHRVLEKDPAVFMRAVGQASAAAQFLHAYQEDQRAAA